MVTDAFIDELIKCPKKVIKVDRKKMMSENRSSRNSVYLSSVDDKYDYKMFLRQSDEFSEDFSVGLIWTNANKFIEVSKNIILFRCQGPHDSKVPESPDIHHSFHIHIITPDDIKAKRYKKPAHKSATNEFSSFTQAALFFVRTCGIIDIEKYIDYPFNLREIEGQETFF